MYSRFALGPGTVEDEHESCKEAKMLFEAAREKVVLLAHLQVCQAMKGAEQLREADKLDQKDAKVPKPLKEHIAVLAKRHRETIVAPSGPPSKKSRKGDAAGRSAAQ